MTYQAVIFDLDGVICNTDEYHYLAWKDMADHIGVPFDRTVNNRLRGVSRMESLNIILEQYDGAMTEAEKTVLTDLKNERYRNYLKQMTPADLPGEVRGTLEELRRRGYLLGIGSSSKNTPTILARIGLGDFFDAVSDGNNIRYSKPDPEVFVKAAQMLGVPVGACLVVEDAVSGAAAGHAGGMDVACVGDAARQKAGEYNLDSITRLLEILKGAENAA